MTDIIQELRGLIAKGVPESDSGWYISNTTGSGLSIIEDGLMFPGSGICPIKCEAPQAALIVAAINHLPALLDRLEAAERGGTADWQPRVGEEIRLTDHFLDQYPEWRDGSRFWCAGISKDRASGYPVAGLNVTLAEEWPPTRKTGGYTDGFYIGRAGVPDDIEPVPAIREVKP